MTFNLKDTKNVIVFGGSRGIGLALVRKIAAQFSHIRIYACYRSQNRSKELLSLSKDLNIVPYQIDASHEEEVKKMKEDLLQEIDQVDLIINTIGFLHDKEIKPEKSLSQFNSQDFISVTMSNTVPTGLIAKHFVSLLPKKKMSAFVVLSAKVGSIEDNKMGGWYSYRMSKAALNMLIKNISIEYARKNKCLVAAIHPGTTETGLSKPFIKNTSYTVHTPEVTADHILEIVEGMTEKSSGSFISWNKEILPW